MRITETENTLRLGFYPVSRWIWGTVFALVFGGFLLFMLWSAWARPREVFGSAGQSWYELGLTIFMYVLVVGFTFAMVLMFGMMARSAAIITTIDRKSQTIFIRRRKLFGSSEDRYLFSQIRKFDREIFYGETKSEYVALFLANGDTVKVETDHEADPQEIIDRLNSFVRGS